MSGQPRVVIVGGGFGGLNAARALAGLEGRVTLVDRRNHHLFQPLLYQVATAALSPAEITSPIRGVLRRQRNADVVLAEVTRIDPDAKRVHLADGGIIPYDYLVLASGAVDQYFGHPEWAALAPGLKSIEDATEIRKRFLLAFEAAEREPDEQVRRSLLTTVVIGAGPTGVEMAGAMAEMARHSLIRDFRRIDPGTARIILVEGGDRILSTYHPGLSRRAEAALVRRGVEVRTNRMVDRIDGDMVQVGGEWIRAHNIVWAAGVAASPLGAALGVGVDPGGRVIANPDCSVPGYPDLFVIGDVAHLPGPDGSPLPGLAPVATQQGRAVGANILRRVAGEPTTPFRYVDKGTMATIGRGAAIAEVGRIRLHGLIAWLAWIFIHIFFLIGFRNRIAVLFEWAWAYLSWQRGARLITGSIEDGRDISPTSTARPGPARGAPPPSPSASPASSSEAGRSSGDRSITKGREGLR